MRRQVYAWLVATIAAVFPTVVTAGEQEDQRIADHINQRLIAEKDRGALSDFSLDLYVEDGQVWFKGHVTSAEQEQLVFSTAQSAKELGVVKIYDMIEVKTAQPAMADQAKMSAAALETSQVKQTSNEVPSAIGGSSRRATQPTPAVGSGVPANFAQLQPLPQPAQQAIPMSVGYHNRPLAVAPAGYAPQQAPANYVPTSHPGAMGARHDQPNMPGYAWPAYASHPNYGAVTYPQQYSPTAWPYIGPFYPYPQVPLGWRKVTMEWDDGWWYLDFQDR